jgi:hypothetical protein
MAIEQTGPLAPEALLAYSERHLYHELTMFWKLADILPKQVSGIIKTALLESYVIHLRNLIEFFYRRRTDLREYERNLVIAEDFFDDSTACLVPKKSDELKRARDRAHEEVSHLTTGRIGEGEDWKVVQLSNEIKAVATGFAREASRAKLHEKVILFLLSPEAKVTLMLGEASYGTNTVSAVSILSFTEWHWMKD